MVRMDSTNLAREIAHRTGGASIAPRIGTLRIYAQIDRSSARRPVGELPYTSTWAAAVGSDGTAAGRRTWPQQLGCRPMNRAAIGTERA